VLLGQEGVSKSSMKISSVECGRGVAALLVVLVHAGSFTAWPKFYGERPLWGLFDWCHAGVDFFFVLSGFIIAYVHWRDVDTPAAVTTYAWRRISRIYPPYWGIMLLVIPMYILSPTVTRYEQDPTLMVLSWFLLTPGFQSVYAISWSLVHEMFFYLLFAMLVLSWRLGSWAGGFILVGTLVYQTLGYAGLIKTHFLLDFIFNFYNFQFFAGFLAALLLMRQRVPRPLVFLAAGAIVFVGTGMVEVYTSLLNNQDLRKLGYGLGAVLMLIGLVEGERCGVLNVPRLWAKVGSTSYSIYLVHVFALNFIVKGFELAGLKTVFPQTVTYVMFVVLAAGAGIAYGFLIEQPLQRLTRQVPLRSRTA